MSFGLQPIALPYGNTDFQAYLNTANNQAYFADRIAEYGVLEFGALAANQTKKLDLGAKGLTSPIILRSLYVFSSSTTNDEIKEFVIYRKNANGNLSRFATQRFSNNEMPYQFPNGGILFPFNVIEVKPRYNTENILAYVQPVNILFSISADT